MATPSTRTPIRLARGTYSNLNSSIADLQEGEIVYATDQNNLYVKGSKIYMANYTSGMRVVDFNNIIGEPVNRYRQNYKEMGKIRQLFYERVDNTPNLEKYINFYKWIDSAISKMVYQLVPASANM